MADGTQGVGELTSVTVERAKEIMATALDSSKPFKWDTREHLAMANKIVSNAQTISSLSEALETYEQELKEAKAAIRRAQDQFDEQSDLIEQLRAELGRCS